MSKPSFDKCGGLDVVEVQSSLLHDREMGFIRLASTIKLIFLVEILMLVCVQDYSSKFIAKDLGRKS